MSRSASCVRKNASAPSCCTVFVVALEFFVIRSDRSFAAVLLVQALLVLVQACLALLHPSTTKFLIYATCADPGAFYPAPSCRAGRLRRSPFAAGRARGRTPAVLAAVAGSFGSGRVARGHVPHLATWPILELFFLLHHVAPVGFVGLHSLLVEPAVELLLLLLQLQVLLVQVKLPVAKLVSRASFFSWSCRSCSSALLR